MHVLYLVTVQKLHSNGYRNFKLHNFNFIYRRTTDGQPTNVGLCRPIHVVRYDEIESESQFLFLPSILTVALCDVFYRHIAATGCVSNFKHIVIFNNYEEYRQIIQTIKILHI